MKKMKERVQATIDEIKIAKGDGKAFDMATYEVRRICENTLVGVPIVDGHRAPMAGSPQAKALDVLNRIEAAKANVEKSDAEWAARHAWDALRVYVDAHYQLNIREDLERANKFASGRPQKSKNQITKDRENFVRPIAKQIKKGPHHRIRLANAIFGTAGHEEFFDNHKQIYRWIGNRRFF